jgi:hypothetical protein
LFGEHSSLCFILNKTLLLLEKGALESFLFLLLNKK